MAGARRGRHSLTQQRHCQDPFGCRPVSGLSCHKLGEHGVEFRAEAGQQLELALPHRLICRTTYNHRRSCHQANVCVYIPKH